MFCLYYVLNLTFIITIITYVIHFVALIFRFFASIVFILGHQVTKSLKTSLELHSRLFMFILAILPSLSRVSSLNFCQVLGSNSQILVDLM